MNVTEDDVRTMLQRRAGDVRPSPDAWEQLTARLEAPGVATLDERRRRPRWILPVVAAAAVVALAVTAGVVARDDDDSTGVVAAVPEAGTPTTEVAPGWAAFEPVGVWPATTDKGMSEAAAAAASGERPELLEPETAAAAYLDERGVPSPQVGVFRQGDVQSGEVPYQFGDGASGTVLVRQYGEMWVVVGSMATDLAVGDLAYDGERLTGQLVPATSADVELTIRPADGDDPVSVGALEGTADQAILLDEPFADGPAVVVQLRLVGGDGLVGFAEELVSAPVSAVPPPTEGTEGFEGIWPTTDPQLQTERDAQAARNPDDRTLADAGEVARLFLQAQEIDAQTGAVVEDELRATVEVTYGGVTSSVALARTTPGRGAWYVTGMTAPTFDDVSIAYEDRRLTVEVEPAQEGEVAVFVLPGEPHPQQTDPGAQRETLAAGERHVFERDVTDPTPFRVVVQHAGADGLTFWMARVD